MSDADRPTTHRGPGHRTRARRLRRRATPLTAILVAILALGAVALTSSGAATAVGHPPDPRADVAPKYISACSASSTHYTRACLLGALRDLDRGRAADGVRTTRLPSNFLSLTAPQQLFVITNMERIDRHLSPMAGLSTALNRYAAKGARAGTDPAFPPWAREGGANWASPQNALMSDFYWVYVDGYGTFNVDCPSPKAAGCWGHRHNILGRWTSPTRMGAATASGGSAEIFLGQDRHDRMSFTWAKEKRFLAHPITVRSLTH